jgi:amino acid adenylation domain-containing protein
MSAPMVSEVNHADVQIRELSGAEDRLFFINEVNKDSAMYNIVAAVGLNGALNEVALCQSLNLAVAAHPILYCSYERIDGRPMACAREFVPFDVENWDVSYLSEQFQVDALNRKIVEVADQVADISKPPLIRFFLVRKQSDQFILLLVVNHICADGWSLGILFRDAVVHYNRITADGGDGSLPVFSAAPDRYRDFVDGERKMLAADCSAIEAFWSQYLAVAPPRLPLTPHEEFKTEKQSQAAIKRFHFGQDDSAKMAALQQQYGVTRFTLLLSAFSILIAKLYDIDEFLLSIPVANRTDRADAQTVGLFVNTIPFRIKIDADLTFSGLCRGIQEEWNRVRQFQSTPLGKILADYKARSKRGDLPVFQLCFLYQGGRLRSPDIKDLEVSALDGSELDYHSMEVPNGMAKFDLALTISSGAAGVKGYFEFDSRIFDEEVSESFRDSFVRLMKQLVDESDRRISSLQITERMTKDDIVGAQALERALPFRSILERIDEYCSETPSRLAIENPKNVTVSYGELSILSDRIAFRLQGLGVKTGDIVGILAGQTGLFQAAVVAVWKLGAAYAPFDLGHPLQHIENIAAIAAIKVIIAEDDCDPSLLPELNYVQPRQCQTNGVIRTSYAVQPSDRAYVIFTSGSTGAPKGVVVSHGNLSSLADALAERFDLLGHPMRHLQSASAAFDVCTEDLIRALAFGGTLVLLDQNVLLDPKKLLTEINERRIDFAEFVPSVWLKLAQQVSRSGVSATGLSWAVTGAEAVSMQDLGRISAILGKNTTLINSYGITETTIDNFLYEYDGESSGSSNAPIGKPLSNTAAVILNANLQPVPSGFVGDLYLLGPCISEGYLDSDQAVLSNFMDGTQIGIAGHRAFRTGDRARMLRTGNVECVGRRDGQIKRRGVRIELASVEAHLRNHPDVEIAAAQTFQIADGVVLAAYVCGELAPDSEASIMSWLRERLPRTQCPDTIVILTELPTTRTGKIDRSALPEPDVHRIAAPIDNPIQIKIAETGNYQRR